MLCGVGPESMFEMSKAPAERRPTQRDQQKAETRARVVEAARALFTERGYEAATIRDIAKRAGVAPGSVFTTFASKAELLQDIIYSKYSEMFPKIAAVARAPGPVAERLAEIGRICYAFELRELRLVTETLGASWSWSAEDDAENRQRLGVLLNSISDILAQGAERGEIGKQVDRAMALDMIFACYLRNFRRALFDDWSAEQLAAHFAGQVALLLQGLKA